METPSTDVATTHAAPPALMPPAPSPAPAAPVAGNPFGRGNALEVHALAPGAVAIEMERAVAEAQGKLVIAKRFPRDPHRAWERVMEACRRPGLAASAFYRYRRGATSIEGPTIRLAEELARCWGNIDYGMRELSNRDGTTEIEAYAWDMETNTISKQQFTVRHVRDRNENGAKVHEPLTDQRDIYELGANMGARRLRARILAIIPDDLVSAATAECRKTLKGEAGKALPEKIQTMATEFGKIGVSVAHLKKRLGHALSETLPDELVDLHGIFVSMKEGHSKASAWFGGDATAETPPTPPAGKRARKAASASSADSLSPGLHPSKQDFSTISDWRTASDQRDEPN